MRPSEVGIKQPFEAVPTGVSKRPSLTVLGGTQSSANQSPARLTSSNDSTSESFS
jgi:hypothetical protein